MTRIHRALRDRRGAHFGRALAVGVLAGVVVALFQTMLLASEKLRSALLDSLHAHSEWGWAVFALVALACGSLSGWLVQRFAPEAAGSGIPHVKAVLLHGAPLRSLRVLLVKVAGGILAIGGGLSLGREGPSVHIGAAIGGLAGRALKVRARAVPRLISCGAGAGLAAAFNAPLAGFIFVLEELRKEMSAITYGGALISAIGADVVLRSLNGDAPAFRVRHYLALPIHSLPLVIALGVLCGGLGVAFDAALVADVPRRLSKIRVPAWLRPGLAAMLIAVVMWWMPLVGGSGHLAAQHILTNAGSFPLWTLVLILALKFGATILSYRSGAPGGIFAPMLLLGAVTGLIVHRTAMGLFAFDPQAASAFAVIGMAAFFTASVRAPLTGIVLLLEMTANYEQLLSLGLACLTAYLFAEWSGALPIYDALLNRMERPLLSGEGGDRESLTFEVSVEPGSAFDGRTVREVKLPRGALLVTVVRAGKEFYPAVDFHVKSGDHLIWVVRAGDPMVNHALKVLCEFERS